MPGENEHIPTAVPLRLLCLDPQEPSWTGMAMALETHLGRPLRLRWCDNPGVAISLLRSEQFDCIVVACLDRANSPTYSASKVVQAIRSVGCDDPILVLISHGAEQELNLLADLDCEVISAGWESSSLATWTSRAIRRHESHREHLKLSTRDSRRRDWERGESLLQLQQQREIAARFIEHRMSTEADVQQLEQQPRNAIPEQVRNYYLELLRAYVIMGTGNLSDDLAQLSQGLARAGVTLPEAFDLHLDCLARLLEGLGLQSLRHIVSRANLLAVEFLLNMSRSVAAESPAILLGSYGIDLEDASLQA